MQILRFLHPASRVFLLAALFLPAVLSAQIKVVTNGDVGVGIDPPTVKLDVNGAIRLRAALHDIANNTGNAGQILSSTGTGVQWINPPGALPTGTSTQTLRYDASNVLVATSTITNDGTNVGIGGAPNALFRAFIYGPLGVNGSGVFSGAGSGPGTLNAAGIRLGNTTPTTGDTYYLSSENNGTAIFRGANSGIIYTANTLGDMLVNFRLGIGDVTGITPNTIIGRDANGMVGTVSIGSGLSLTGGTLTATGGGGNYTAGTGINITGNVISNTGDVNAADDITNSTAANGDLNGTYPNPTVDGLQNRPVSATAPTSGQVLEWNGTAWAPAADDSNTYTAGTGISIAGNVVTNTGDTNAADDITTASNAAGDVTGPFSNLQIVANAVGTTEIANSAVTGAKIAQAGATTGQVLEWNGTTWAPAADDGVAYTAGTGISIAGNVITNTGDTNTADDITNSTAANGDLNGTYPNPTVDGLQNRPVSATAPTNGQVLEWNGTAWAPATDDSGAPAGTTTQTLRYDATNTLVATSTITNDGTNVGIGAAPNALFRANINGPTAVNGSGVFSGAGSGPGTLNAAGIRLGNTTPTTGDTYYLSSENDGTALFRAANAGIIYTTNTSGDLLVNYQLGIGDVTGITPNTIIGRDANGKVGTVGIGSGLSLAGGTLTATGGGYTAGTGINITGNVISNTGDTNGADDVLTTTNAGGDVSGTFSNLQIVANAVGSSEIADGSVTTNEILNGTIAAVDLNSMGATSGQVLKWNGSAWAPAADNSGAPAGTSTQTLRYDATNTLVATSTLTNDGTNVAVGTTTLNKAKFNVEGVQNYAGIGDVNARFSPGGPMSANARAVLIEGNSTVSVYGFDDAIAAVSSNLIERQRNTATTAGSSAIRQTVVSSNTAGDPTDQFIVENTGAAVTTFTVGLDNSDGDKFKIQPYTALNSTAGNELGLTIIPANGRTGINKVTPLVTLDASNGTDAVALPRGTTANRPAGVLPYVRYNTTTQSYEALDLNGEGFWHRITASSSVPPTLAAGTGAGTGPTFSIIGDDLRGVITLTTGSAPVANGAILTVTFGNAYSYNPYAIVTPNNAQAATDMTKYFVSATAFNNFVLTANGTLAANTQYKFTYQVQN